MSLEVIKEASAAGVRLFLSNGQLKVMAEKGALTPELKSRILAAKREVIALLAEINAIGSHDEAETIKPALRKGNGLPLSYQQQRLWVLNELQQGSSEYGMPMAFTIRGPFRPDTAEKAIRAIIARHEVLRSNYFPADAGPSHSGTSQSGPGGSGLSDSGVVQKIRSDANFRLARMDLTQASGEKKTAALDAALLADAKTVFNLQGDLLLRATWIQLEADTGVLSMNMHHIVSDGWSMDILMREFITLYQAFVADQDDPLPPLPIQYADYAVWKRQHLTEEKIKQQAEYWRRQLADAPLVHSVPLDFERPTRKSHQGASYKSALPFAAVEKLNALAGRHGMTLFMLIHAALGLLITRHSNSKDAMIGTPLANRLNRQLEPLIGFFVNTLVLRARVDESASIDDYLQQVREVNLSAQSNQDVPFEMLLETLKIPRSMSHTPVFQIMLTLDNTEKSASAQGLFTVEPRDAGAEFAKYDLTVNAGIGPDGLELNWNYDVSLFKPATIERLSRHLKNILSALATSTEGRVRDVAMLSEGDRHRLVHELNDTKQPYDFSTPVHEYVAQHAAASPGRIAVTCGNESIDYRELENKANDLADFLRKRGVKAEQRVGIAVAPSIDTVVAILAVMKVGGIYVPLDGGHSRIEHIVNDSAMCCLLADASTAERLKAFPDLVVPVDVLLQGDVRADEVVPAAENRGPDSVVYILYTSGSTGLPTGVAVTERSLANYLSHAKREYMRESLRGAVMSSPQAFEATLTTLFTPLICGKELVILPERHTGLVPKIARYLFEQGDAWLFKLTPAYLEKLAAHLSDNEHGNDAAHVIVVGGEPLYKRSVLALRRAGLTKSVLINEYGQTETVAGCSIHTINPDDELSSSGMAMPIGRPIQNTELFVIDNELPIIDLEADAPLWAEQSRENPEPRALGLSARNLAYIIYTSGSTGRPKGVMIEHANITRLFAATQDWFHFDRNDVWTLFHSFAFDFSVWEIWGALIHGGRLVIVPHLTARSPEEFYQLLCREGVTVLNQTPIAFRQLIAAQGRSEQSHQLREVIFGGEALDVLALKPWYERSGNEHTRLVNMYGITETTVHATFRALEPADTAGASGSPIGRPIPDLKLYILDAQRRPAPIGVVGEIYVGGAGVARGYLNRPELTAERFIESPFISGDRLYTSGDLGRYLPDGNIEFLGRNDFQVKIRGFRIELGEIEAQLSACEGVREAVVIAREDTPGDKRLVAYYTAVPGAEINGETLKSQLSRTLASYMVPVAYVQLPALPLTINGKLDRKALPVPADQTSITDEHEALLSVVEGSRQGRAPSEQEAFFRQMLGEVEEPTAPFGLLASHGDGAAITEATRVLDARLSSRLRRCARMLGVSAASIFHVAWGQLISRASAQDDPVFGTVVAGCIYGSDGVGALIEPFVNTLPVKVRLKDRSVEQCVRDTHKLIEQLALHGHASMAAVQQFSPVSAGAPLFAALLNYRHCVSAEKSLDAQYPAGEVRTNYPLTLCVEDDGEGFALTAQVTPSIGPDRINAMSVRVLEEMADALEGIPARPVSELEVLPEDERQRLLVQWNETPPTPPQDRCIHELFEEQAARNPGAVAVTYEDQQLTYGELNRRANQLAHYLRTLGVAPDQRVALCVERSLEMVVGLLGILKAGAAYVPLDPAYPIERLSYMLKDSAAVVALCHAPTRAVLQAAAQRLGRESLAPFGAVGELYIAGDGLAKGYINRDDLQARSFVSLELAAGVSKRLYRTGDLVRYNAASELEYIGRADQQIIVRGFRVEPGEIQAQLCAHPRVKDVVVLRAAQGEVSSLVAFVVPRGPVVAEEEEQFAASLREWSKKRLTAYLQPTIYKLIEEIPLTSHGKVDKRALLKLPLFVQVEGGYVPPRNNVERILCEIYAGLLKVERVGVHDNFFALGGDSILSIQAVSRARKAGINLSATKIFTHQTVAELAQVAEVSGGRTSSAEDVTGEMPLLPIHRWFFSSDSVAVNHFNQSVLLTIPSALTFATVKKLVRALYLRHDALRLRFVSSGDQWQACFVPFEEGMLEQSCVAEAVPEAKDSAQAPFSERCEHVQSSLNLESGPLFKAVHFTLGTNEHRLLLVFHHVVVDGVSWRVLMADIEEALRQCQAGKEIYLPDRGSSCKDWSLALEQYSRSESLMGERAYWLQQLQASAALPVKVRPAVPPKQAETGEVCVQLSKDETKQLLGKCSQAYSMRTAELLIAALSMGLGRWLKRESVLIGLEGHGREELFPDVDISSTVGWFTTLYPMALNCAPRPVSEVLVSVKEQVRSVPKNGIGYGVLRYIAQDDQIVAAELANAPQLLFNYLGQLDQALETGTELAGATEDSGKQISPERSRSHQIAVNARVAGGVLRFIWDFSAMEFDPSAIELAANHVLTALREAIEHCVNVKTQIYTPNDFPDADVSLEQLRDWQAKYSFEKLYRVTPAQQGMLAASELERTAYVTQFCPALRGQVDEAALEQAWQHVVDQHDVLKTVFVTSDNGIHQLVLTAHKVSLRVIDLMIHPESERESVFERHRHEDKEAGFVLNTGPVHRIALFRMGHDRYRLLLTHHHAILDGWSMPIIQSELFSAYQGSSASRPLAGRGAPDYEKYVSWLYSQSFDEAKRYWQRYLGDITETALLRSPESLRLSSASYSLLPALLSAEDTDKLRVLASSNRTTLNTVVQLAWSVVLKYYTGKDDVIFGAVVSGRPSEVAGVEKMAGLFVNTIPVRINLKEGSIAQTLSRLQADLVESNKYAHLSFADIKRQTDVRSDIDIFETIIDFKNYPLEARLAGTQSGGLVLEDQKSHDRNNFSVTLVIGVYEKLMVNCCYRDDLLPQAFISTMIEDFVAVLRALPSADSLSQLRPPGYEKVRSLTGGEPRLHQAVGRSISPARNERQLTKLEEILSRLLASVLVVESVGVCDNFFDLGGDSILAMRLCSVARKQGIPLTPDAIYRFQTIEKIAAELEGRTHKTEARGDSVGQQLLLPVQHQLLVAKSGQHINRLRHFNMASLFTMPDAISFDVIRAAAQALLRRHDALRLQFNIEEGAWCSSYVGYDERMLESVCRCERITGTPEEARAELERRCRAYQEGFDLTQAPLFRLVRFVLPQGARLLLIAHHSIVDVPSWHVLVADLRSAIQQHAETGAITLGAKTSSYQAWGKYLDDCARQERFAGERDYWLEQLPSTPQKFHCERDASGPFTYGSAGNAIVTMTQEETASLLRECHSLYDASINEILISALYCGLCRWSGSSAHSLFIESHGRHSKDLDLSETVGWFTEIYPLALEQSSEDVVDCIEYVKEKYRGVPNQGLGYGVLRYLHNDKALTERAERYAPQVLFNYFGQLDSFTGDSQYLELSSESCGPIAGAEHEMPGKLIFQGGVYSGCLTMNIEYDRRRFSETDIRSLADVIRADLLRLTEAAQSVAVAME